MFVNASIEVSICKNDIGASHIDHICNNIPRIVRLRSSVLAL